VGGLKRTQLSASYAANAEACTRSKTRTTTKSDNLARSFNFDGIAMTLDLRLPKIGNFFFRKKGDTSANENYSLKSSE